MIWDGDDNCEHEWRLYKPGFQSLSLESEIIIINKLRKGDAISDIEIDAIASSFGIDDRIKAMPFKNNRKSDKKFFAAATKGNSSEFVNRTVTIKNTSNKIRDEGNRDKGKSTNKTFSGRNAEINQSIPKIDRPKMKSPINIPSNSSSFRSVGSRGDFGLNKADESIVNAHKADIPIITNTTIGNKKAKNISKIGSPIIKESKIDGVFSCKKLGPTTQVAKTSGMISKLPSRTIDELATKGTGNHSPSKTTNRAASFPNTNTGQPYSERVATTLTNQNSHICMICQKCGAVKCSLGLEPTPELYVKHLVQIFSEVKRVLRKDGTLWLNLGSSYMGSGGAHKEHHANPGISKSFERDGYSGGTLPSQSHSYVLSCGNDGKEQPSLLASDHACLGSCDESQDGCQNHPHCIFHSVQQNQRCSLRSWLTDHDTKNQGSALTSLDALLHVVQESTNLSLSENAQSASVLLAKALVSLLQLCSCSDDAKVSYHTLVCICDIFQQLLTSDCHIRDKVFSFLAYQFPLNGLNKDSLTTMFHKVKFKPKDLIGIPWQVAFALQADGWYLRQDIIWHKPNPMPESVKDRCTRSHEYIFMLTKSAKYYYDHVPIMEDAKDKESYKGKRKRGPKTILTSGCRIGNPQTLDKGNKADSKIYEKVNKRSVWEINTKPCKEAHFAAFPPEIPEICILAGTSEKGCCPKCGSPRERIIQKPDMSERPIRAKESKMNTDSVHISNNWQGVPKSAGQKYQEWRNANPDKTIGWQPTCKCGIKETVPCVILDPFLGSGTSILVAHKLRRHSIGIELSESYLKDIAIPKIEKEIKQLKMF